MRATCKFEDCDRTIHGRQLCSSHYAQYLKGKTLTTLRPARPTREVGSVAGDGHGYLLEKDPTHANARSDGWVRQHVKIMSDSLGRRINTEYESVHHINGDKTDNRLENLELWSNAQPRGQRITDKVSEAVDFLRIYAPELLIESYE